jgi:arylsulfatase A-like enzyme
VRGAARRAGWALATVALAVGLGAQHGCGGKEPPAPTAPKTPSLILVVIDTLRSDMLSGPNGEPAHMPATLAFAKKGVLFPNAVAPAPWTLPTMASLTTGLLPREHGVERMVPVPIVASPIRTWAQVLAARGYQTAAYTGAPFEWFGPSSLLRGFSAGQGNAKLRRALPMLDSWRRSLDPARPFFLLLHFYEAHDPYGERNYLPPGAPPRPPLDPTFEPRHVNEPWEMTRYFMLDRVARDALQTTKGHAFMDAVVRYIWSGYRQEPRPALAAELRAAYTEGAGWVDGLMGELLGWMEREHVLDDAALALTADHGEAFGEHGTLEHGRICYDEVVRVPLVFRGPGALAGGRTVTANVSLMDVVPTLFEACRQPLPDGVEGRSLVPVIEGREGGRIALTQERVDIEVTKEDISLALRSLRSDRWKAILTWDTRAGTVREEAYDLVADPLEQHDLGGGKGTLEGVPFDEAFCRALDKVRAEVRAEGATAPLPRPCGAR